MTLPITPVAAGSLSLLQSSLTPIGVSGGVLDAKAHGCAGDGSTDDTSAFQALVNSAANKTIVVPPGTYVVSSVTLASNVSIIGLNGATLQHKTGASNPVLYWPQSPRSLLSNVTVQGLTFRGDASATTESARAAIYIVLGDMIRVVGCDIADFASAGIHLSDCHRFWVEDNRVVNCVHHGLRNSINVKSTSGLTSPTSASANGYGFICGNYVELSAAGNGAGICDTQTDAASYQRVTISDNIVIGSLNFAGIAVEAGMAKQAIVSGNQVYDSITGVDVLSTGNTQTGEAVTQNIVTGNLVDCGTVALAKGIRVDGTDFVISDNVIKCFGTGITSTSNVNESVANAAIRGNIITIANTDSTDGNRPFGIAAGGGNGLSISGNTIRLASGCYMKDGIAYQGGDGASISGNMVYGPGRSGITVVGTSAKNCSIVGNTVTNPGINYSGFYGVSIAPTAGDFIRVAQNVLTDDQVSHTMGYGINIAAGSTNVTLVDNEIAGFLTAKHQVAADGELGVCSISGAGSPEGSVRAGVGSVYRNTSGGAATSFYVKESGTGNTGWVGK